MIVLPMIFVLDFTLTDTFHYKSSVTCLWTESDPFYKSPFSILPKTNITLNCSEYGEDSLIEIFNAFYVRSAGRGDENCLNKNSLDSCCEGGQWNSNTRRRTRRCIVFITGEVYENMIANCNQRSTCTFGLQAVQLNDQCSNKCVNATPGVLLNETCYTRLAELQYICIEHVQGM